MPINSIVLIGAGNVATQLGKVFHQKGLNILQVYSRTQKSAEALAKIVGSQAISDLSQLNRNAGLYLISVSDDAIGEIISHLNPLPGILAHTSGSVEMDILKKSASKVGVFYPLQTFSKIKAIDFTKIPICIEATDKETEIALTGLASKISQDVRQINSVQRANIHLAAVFVNNFTNYMYFLGEDLLKEEGISFDILLPLIHETAEKMKHQKPLEAQTGPAIRNDARIILKHLNILKDDPEKQEIYRLISQKISKSGL